MIGILQSRASGASVCWRLAGILVGLGTGIGFLGGFRFRVWSRAGRGRGLCGRIGGLVFEGSIAFGDLLGFCGGGCR